MTPQPFYATWSKRDGLICVGILAVFLSFAWLTKQENRPMDEPVASSAAVIVDRVPVTHAAQHSEPDDAAKVPDAPETHGSTKKVVASSFPFPEPPVLPPPVPHEIGQYTASEKTPSPPPSPRSSFLNLGDVGELWLPGTAANSGSGVWLATTDADWDDLIDAENAGARGGPGAGSAIYRMAESGRARKYRNGTRIRVAKGGFLSVFVEVIAGEDQGRSGWVQRELARPVQ